MLCVITNNSNGFQLFDKGHLHDLKIQQACASDIYVRARYTRTTSLRETPYLVWVPLNTEGKVISGVCECNNVRSKSTFKMMGVSLNQTWWCKG